MLAAQGNRTGPDDVAYLWPCNLGTWAAWCAVQTQWRHGPGGPTGLDYTAVRAWLDEQGHPAGPERADTFAGICAAERATLEAWAEKRQRDEQTNQR